MAFFQDLPFGITVIDTDFQRPGLAACHLIIESGKGALVDTGTTKTVPQILSCLTAKQIKPQDIEYLFVTHVHLDHAGGAGQLMKLFPNAKLVAHPRGARHLIDPTKLVSGTKAVFGEQVMQEHYGPVIPVPAERVLEVADGQNIDFHGRPLQFLHTEGHAKHHYCIWDAKSQGLFTGDTFGVSYREFDSDQGSVIFPATTPTQFDPEALHASIDRLVALKPKTIYLTHFGQIQYTERLSDELHVLIDEYVTLAKQFKGNHQSMYQAMMDLLLQKNTTLSKEKAVALLHYDVEINVQGLEYWLDHSLCK